jgi:hypothetical protein
MSRSNPYTGVPDRTGQTSTNNMYGDGDGTTSGWNICLLVVGSIILGLLIWGLVWMAIIKSDVEDIHIKKICEVGDTCQDGALIGGTGICDANGECQGDPKGECDPPGLFPIDFTPADCPAPIWSFPVDTFGLYNDSICWFGRCSWFLVPPFPLAWMCIGPDFGHYEKKKLAEDTCLDFLAPDPDQPYYQATATCIFNIPICIYNYERATHARITPTVAPFAMLANGKTVAEPASGQDMFALGRDQVGGTDKSMLVVAGERYLDWQNGQADN